MRAKLIAEKFDEETDPIEDMGIGNPEMQELNKNYKKLQGFINFEVEDLDFKEVIDVLDNLKKINSYTLIHYLNNKYGFGFKLIDKGDSDPIAEAFMNNVELYISCSNSKVSMNMTIISPYGERHTTSNCRTIHTLEWQIQKIYKKMKVELKRKEA